MSQGTSCTVGKDVCHHGHTCVTSDDGRGGVCVHTGQLPERHPCRLDKDCASGACKTLSPGQAKLSGLDVASGVCAAAPPLSAPHAAARTEERPTGVV